MEDFNEAGFKAAFLEECNYYHEAIKAGDIEFAEIQTDLIASLYDEVLNETENPDELGKWLNKTIARYNINF